MKSFQEILELSDDKEFHREMYRKIIFWFLFWSGTWTVAVFAPVPPLLRIFLGVIHMLSHVFIALNVAHDANHRSITKSQFLSSVLMRSFDLIGISSFCWRRNHNEDHHRYTSIRGHDSTADGKLIMRFTQSAPHFKFHQAQHFYAPLVYSFISLNYLIARDFLDFIRYLRIDKNKGEIVSAFIECLIFKFFYITYTIIIPCLVFPGHVLTVLGVFLLGHILIGQIIILIQVPHFNENSLPVTMEDVSDDEQDNLRFILKHTKDFATLNPFWNWILGGINHHTIHHLAPWLCHTSLPKRTMDLERFCKENGKEYASFLTVKESYLSHYRYLRKLGRGSK